MASLPKPSLGTFIFKIVMLSELKLESFPIFGERFLNFAHKGRTTATKKTFSKPAGTAPNSFHVHRTGNQTPIASGPQSDSKLIMQSFV